MQFKILSFYLSLKLQKIINNIADTDEKQPDGLDVFLNVTSRKLQLVFEMKPGVATSALVSEIFRAFDGT